MQSSFLLLLAVASAVVVCHGAKKLRAQSKMQQSLSQKIKYKTAFNGEQFTSILDHPSTAHFFEGKEEKEIAHMAESALFAHMVGHSAYNTKRARSSKNELSGAAFVQLAAKHGVDFKTLQALHQKSGKGHLDMEIWWREQALHSSVHVESGGEASFEHLERDMTNPLETTLIEQWQRKQSATKRAQLATATMATKATATKATATTATATTATATTASTMRSRRRTSTKTLHEAQEFFKLSKISQKEKGKKALAVFSANLGKLQKAHDAQQMVAVKALEQKQGAERVSKETANLGKLQKAHDAQQMVAVKALEQKQGAERVSKETETSSVAKTKTHSKETSLLIDNTSPIAKTTSFLEHSLNQHQKVDMKNTYGDYCFRSCDTGDCRWCDNGLRRCFYGLNTITGSEHCYGNDDCVTGVCIGNLGSACTGDGGACSYPDYSLSGGHACSKNTECISNTCM